MRKSEYKRKRLEGEWAMDLIWDKNTYGAKPKTMRWIKKHLSRKFRRTQKQIDQKEIYNGN